MRIKAAIGLVFVAACGGGAAAGSDGAPDGARVDAHPPADAAADAPPQHAEWTSGTRLRARVQSSPDGARAWVGWHDATLDLDCARYVTSDGSRCLPDGGAMVIPYYSDASCSTPVARTDDVICSTYAVALSRPGRSGIAYVWSTAGQYSGQTYAIVGASCMSATPPAGLLCRLSAGVAISTFATLSETVE